MTKTQEIKIDNKVTLTYLTINSSQKDKPLLIFLHDGLGSIAQWKKFPEKLCSELNLPGLIYNRYGYGLSTELQEKRNADYLEIEANYFLPQLIEGLNLQNRKIILVGHSDGASIALIYAALHSKNILAIISIAAHVFVEQISIDSIKKLEKEYELKKSFYKSLKKYHFNHTDSTFYAFSDTITSNEFRGWNIETHLSKIKAPVFVIQGDSDEYGSIKQVESIYNKTLHSGNKQLILPNCGHTPHLSDQKIIIQEIITFITEVTCNEHVAFLEK